MSFKLRKDADGRLILNDAGKVTLDDGRPLTAEVIDEFGPWGARVAVGELLAEVERVRGARSEGVQRVEVLRPRKWADLDTEEKCNVVRRVGAEAARDLIDSGAEIPPAA